MLVHVGPDLLVLVVQIHFLVVMAMRHCLYSVYVAVSKMILECLYLPVAMATQG